MPNTFLPLADLLQLHHTNNLDTCKGVQLVHVAYSITFQLPTIVPCFHIEKTPPNHCWCSSLMYSTIFRNWLSCYAYLIPLAFRCRLSFGGSRISHLLLLSSLTMPTISYVTRTQPPTI